MHDVFICHASEDKEKIVRPLAKGLRSSGLNVWYDEFSLKLGDSLRESIDRGLADSRFGIVVLSHHFFSKSWPLAELNGLFAIETAGGGKKIIPIWHEITKAEIIEYSPILADRVAVTTAIGLDAVLERILDTIDTGRQHKAGKGRVVSVTPTSVRLYSGEWQVKTPITITNLGNSPAYSVAIRMLLHGQKVTASSLEVEINSQTTPLEAATGYITVSADLLRLNCSSKDGHQIVMLFLHTVPAKGSRTIFIKGTVPVDSSADITVVDVDERPQEFLTKDGKLALMFKPSEDLVVSGVEIKMRRKA